MLIKVCFSSSSKTKKKKNKSDHFVDKTKKRAITVCSACDENGPTKAPETGTRRDLSYVIIVPQYQKER